MGEKLAYWGSVTFSAIALILLVANISLATSNAALQQEVSARQAALNGGQTYSQLNQNLVQALADSAVKNNNTQIRDLLTSQGITIKPAADAAKAADKPASKK